MRGLLAPLIKLIVFLIVTAFCTYVLGATIANSSYGAAATYKALFTDASGVNPGDDVRVAGVRVGTVKSIKIVNHNYAQITFTVQKSRPLPASAEARLRYRNLVGQRYLDIEQGTGDPNQILKPGSTIGLDHTFNALDLTALFNGFQPLFQGLNADQINSLSGELIQVLQGEGSSIELLLGTLADLTNTIADKDKVIGDVVTNLSSVLTAVGDRDTELSNLILELQRFISGLSQDRNAIGQSLEGINNLTTSTASLLSQVRAPLARDITDLTALTANLNRNTPTLQEFLDQLPPTVAGLIRTGSYGSWFNFYLCSITADVHLPNGPTLPIPVHQPTTVARCK
ncbi:MAG: phospholipid/cholesterol/gamma-HCH transport system substrate-binding protein [Pseudonocardiales bacterium]|jgi:phospholipid/cholesterol/gamma-HCH transport system substrate-binding protein|nr:phospholipid/cholesterol/gamma-HCH transport system substrate-binding protein [Pseudonocardiales bacterium]